MKTHFVSKPRLTKSLKAASTILALGAMVISTTTLTSAAHAAIKTTAKPATKTTAKPATKPSIGTARPGIAGSGAEGRQADPARAAAFAKYQKCLTDTGVALPNFASRGFAGGGAGRPGMGNDNAVRPSGAPVTPGTPSAPGAPGSRPSNFPMTPPTLTAEQQAALNSCASLRPTFGRGNRPGGFDPNGANPDNPMKQAKPAPSKVAKKPTAPRVGGAAYIACLNAKGVNVKSSADIAGLDKASPKIASALAACAKK